MLLVRRAGIPVLQPLLELPLPADAIGCQRGARGSHAVQEARIGAQQPAGMHGAVKQVAQDLPVHRRAGAQR